MYICTNIYIHIYIYISTFIVLQSREPPFCDHERTRVVARVAPTDDSVNQIQNLRNAKRNAIKCVLVAQTPMPAKRRSRSLVDVCLKVAVPESNCNVELVCQTGARRSVA